MSWGERYWPVWLTVMLLSFLGPEVYALATGQPSNTLSAWVWRALAIHRDETVGQWSALDFLMFGLWVTLVAWLTFHFFFGRFT